MSAFAYTTVPGKLDELLGKIQTIGVPSKATAAWLKSIGFKSSNDASLLTVLKFVGLCSESGEPTTTWKSYRTHERQRVLGEAIRAGYKDLFAVYPDAEKRTDPEITSFFASHSDAGEQVLSKGVRTFRILCGKATFDGAPLQAAHMSPLPPGVSNPIGNGGTATSYTIPQQSAPNQPAIHIDVQIHISPETTGDQIDRIFESMARHLYNRS